MPGAVFTPSRIDEQRELIAIEGELDAANARELRRHVDAALAAGRRRLVIDLVALGHLDSSGLAELIRAHQRAASAGGCLMLAIDEASGLRRVIEVRGLDRLFSVAPNRSAALEAALFRPEGASGSG